jgi:hypothetical protein
MNLRGSRARTAPEPERDPEIEPATDAEVSRA